MYRNVLNIVNGNIDESVIVRIADGAFIPCVEGNRDYQEYLKWVADGGVIQPPEPAGA